VSSKQRAEDGGLRDDRFYITEANEGNQEKPLFSLLASVRKILRHLLQIPIFSLRLCGFA